MVEVSPCSHTIGGADAPDLPQDCQTSLHKHTHNLVSQWTRLGNQPASGFLKAVMDAFNSLPNSNSETRLFLPPMFGDVNAGVFQQAMSQKQAGQV